MNRADRRRAGRRAPRSISQFAAAYECPDCLSDVTYPIADEHGVWRVNVLHDPTCWTYRRLLANGLAS